MSKINPAKSKPKTQKLTRIDTLIITIGTRQIGWRCQDNIVRCFGTDGEKGDPPHIEELYRELSIPQIGYHQDSDRDSRWNVRDLGRRYYQLCTQSPQPDFSRVELLMDEKIIADSVRCGLNHLILWATDQPEDTSWRFRRQDTIWLAKLMAAKIQEKWPNLQVDIRHPILNAANKEKIRQELENEILPFALKPLAQKPTDTQFVLAIENTGCAPSIAEGLSICVAALVRQCQVLNLIPTLPDPLYQGEIGSDRNAQKSVTYQAISVGEYFWPLERSRVLSAWKRGDFKEAEIWLTAHQSRYEGLLYHLAKRLSLLINGDYRTFLATGDRGIETWLQSPALKHFTSAQQIQQWQKQVNDLRSHSPAQVWESIFLIELSLYRGEYPTAFGQFSQTLERLLYLQYKTDHWLNQGYVTIPNHLTHLGNQYQPGLKQLIDGWFDATGKDKQGSVYSLFDNIRNTRNAIVHKAEVTNIDDITSVWTQVGWTISATKPRQMGIIKIMVETLQMVLKSDWETPDETLGRSLWQWGLQQLQKDSPSDT